MASWVSCKGSPMFEVNAMQMFDSRFDYKNDFVDRWNAQVKRTKAAMIAWGVVLVLAGVFAIAAPYSLYAAIQLVAGVALVVHGVGQVYAYIKTPELFRNSALVVSGILNGLLGIMFLALPAVLTAGTLVYLLAFLFILTGVERISFARQMKYFRMPHASMGTVTGVFNIVLGIVFILMPVFSSLVLGYLLAAYLIVGGITLFVEAFAAKRLDL